jgi:hypothetical protein
MEIVALIHDTAFDKVVLYAKLSPMSDNTALHKMAEDFYIEILAPSLSEFTRKLKIPPSFEADRFLLAIAMQESGLEHRYQLTRIIGKAGPARGWWQFESVGVAGVMQHRESKALAERWAAHCRVRWHRDAIHRALEGHDVLAVGIARLLIWSSPNPLPTTEESAWLQYAVELWRPGKPHVKKWPAYWRIADAVVKKHRIHA